MAHDSSKLDNEEPGCQAPELSSRCVNNCGFFGSPATSNFCSRCYAEVVVKTKPSYPAAEKISASDPSSKLLGEPAGGMAELGLQLASFAAKSVAEERAVSDPAAQIQESEIGVAELGTRAVEIEVSSVASTSSRADVPGIVTDVLRAATVFEVSGHQPQRPTPNRCLTCRKRVGLTGFKCRCGDVFCALHRYSDKHNCSYDYKAAGREAIAKANPIVVARKIEKI